MAGYGGGYGQARHGLMVEEEEDEDLYEGFNFSIDLAPPQTASTTNYMSSSYGAPASRGGYNPPGTAFRAPPSQMGRQIPGSRLGTSQQQAGEARPMTSVSGAGFSSNPRTASGQRVFDPMGEARKVGAAPALVEKTENSPKEVAKELERTVNSLIEQSAELISKEQYEEALHLAKDAGRKERAFNKHCELNGLADMLNIDLTYAVFFNLANAYHLNGLWKEAIQSYTPIVKNKQYAQGGRLRVNMGNIYFEQQQYPTAIRMYRMALDQIPNTSKEVRYKIKRNIGAAQIKLGHYQDAAATFEDVMEGNADFQSGFNLIICYYAIGEHEKMRRGFTNLITIPMEGMSDEDEDELGLANESKHSDDDHTSSKEHLHSLKTDGLKAEIRARRKKAMEYILVAAKLCAPALDKKDWLAGFTWVIDALKQETHESLVSEMEICKAHWFLKEKEFGKAIEVLKAFEKKDPAHKAMAATNLSYLYFVEGDTAQADKYASLAVRHQRYNAKALVNKGNCLYVKNECERAKELFLEAIGVEADCIEAIYNLGLVNIKMGVLNEALQAFEKLHSIVPTNTEVLYQIANLHDMMSNYRQAAKWFNILLSCFGGSDKRDRNAKNVADPGVLARLGQIFNKDDDETQAFHYHLESYRYFPINLDVISWLGVWYVKSELYEKAIQFFERASQIQPNEVKWRLMVTSCYRRMGAYQKAVVLYEQIHQDYPENLECLRYLVAICKDLGQRCDGFQAKLAKLERDNAVNTKMPPQQQPPQSLGNGHSSSNSNADDDDPRAPPSYQRQPQEMQYQRQDSGRALPPSSYGNGNTAPDSRTRDNEDNDRSEYVAPPQIQLAPTMSRAPQPQKTARPSKQEDTDDWGDADVGNLLGD
ncbi:Intraflagellar transport protein 88 [Phytophthora rubi]|uniref:Intraflagellar transport protein 88 n=1 Tax=Phytophthora rubi TaxID=129364 RepID=A0A6A4FYV4_9STRA|nr:Intraflagellar transport protein 88 [Phytophthora rubi]